MDKTIPGEKFDLGLCYYPKHWPEQMWADDYKLIKFPTNVLSNIVIPMKHIVNDTVEIHLLLVESFRQEHISLDTRAQRGFIFLGGAVKSFV